MIMETAKAQRMIHVPAGVYTIGSNDGRADEQPVHAVTLSAFEMDEYLLTVNDVYGLLGTKGEDLPTAWRVHPPAPGDVPATRLSLHEAEAIGRRMGKRLPTEDEFEGAFRYRGQGSQKERVCMSAKPFPLMTAGEAERCGLRTGAGFIAMAGVVWQWTASTYGWYPGPVETLRPPLPGDWAVVRGGIWSDYDARPSLRSFRDPEAAYTRVGVRFVRDIG